MPAHISGPSSGFLSPMLPHFAICLGVPPLLGQRTPPMAPTPSIPVHPSELGPAGPQRAAASAGWCQASPAGPRERGTFPGGGPGTPQLSIRVVAGNGMAHPWCRGGRGGTQPSAPGAGMPAMQNHPRLPSQPPRTPRGPGGMLAEVGGGLPGRGCEYI